MTAPAHASRTLPPAGRLVSEAITFVVIGWLVAYNALRLGGSSPADAAWPGLLIGAVGGLAVLAAWLVIRRRLVESGRMAGAVEHLEVPPPQALDAGQRRLLDLLWPVVAALGAASVAVGALMAADWLDTAADDRSTAKIMIAGWNVLAGVWMLAEGWCMRRHDGGGVDSIALGSVLTAVLAGVSLSRDYVPAGQVVLILLGGIASAGAYYTVWRLTRRPGFPYPAGVAAVVALLALVLPVAA